MCGHYFRKKKPPRQNLQNMNKIVHLQNINKIVHLQNVESPLVFIPSFAGGAEDSGASGPSSGGAGEEELRAGAGQAGERPAGPGEAGPGGQGLGAVPPGGRIRGDAGQPQAGPGEQGGGAQPQTAVSCVYFIVRSVSEGSFTEDTF